jgi:hypothetical protein
MNRMASKQTRGHRKPAGKGPFRYKKWQDNYAIWPGREPQLSEFLRQSFKGTNHKVRNSISSHSEDALTWSCFDTLRNLNEGRRGMALAELWELAYDDMDAPEGFTASELHIGKSYGIGRETTEVDLSFEGGGFLVLVEAKLYSPISQADDTKPHNQIARKLTIGLRAAQAMQKEFYFILLDIAPAACLSQINPGASLQEAKEKASGFGGKWLTSYWFSRYKKLSPLRDLLSKEGLNADVSLMASRMGWLTWADVFKVVLRAVISG